MQPPGKRKHHDAAPPREREVLSAILARGGPARHLFGAMAWRTAPRAFAVLTRCPEATVKKVKLNPESLDVQSFDIPAEGPRERGTVHARENTHPAQCYSDGSCVFPCTYEPDWCV